MSLGYEMRLAAAALRKCSLAESAADRRWCSFMNHCMLGRCGPASHGEASYQSGP